MLFDAFDAGMMPDEALLNGLQRHDNRVQIISNGSKPQGSGRQQGEQFYSNVEKKSLVNADRTRIVGLTSSNASIEVGVNSKTHGMKEPPDGGTRAWLVVMSAFICNGVIFGIINTYGIIHAHLQERLAEKQDTEASSKAALVGSLTIGTTFLLSPVSGMLTDKIGLRRTTLIGGILSVTGMLLSSFFSESVEILCLTYGVMFGVGAALAYTPTLAILGHYFKRYLGKVSGFVTAGSSVFTAIMPLALNDFVKYHGLDVTLKALAGFASFIILAAFVYKPLHPPPEPPPSKPGRSAANTFLRSFLNVDIWKRKKYIIWSLSVPLALFGYFVPYVHMVKFVETNFQNENTNLPVMMIGVSSGVGRLAFGFIADLPKVNRILLQQISLMCIGLFSIILPLTHSYTLLVVMTFIMGLFDGCFISLLGPIAYEICGHSGATQAIGFLLGLSSLPLTVGPVIAGKIFDKTGSYTVPFVLAGVPPIIGASLMFFTRCVPDEGEERDISSGQAFNSSISKEGSPEARLVSILSVKDVGNERRVSLAAPGISSDCGLLKPHTLSLDILDSNIVDSSDVTSKQRRYQYSIL